MAGRDDMGAPYRRPREALPSAGSPTPPPPTARPSPPTDRLRRPTLPSGMDLSGTWRAALADDDLRREAVQPEYDDDGGSGCRSPVTGGRCRRSRRATARSSTAPASTSSAAPDEARHWLVLDGLFYQGDVWLDGAYLGDPEGYFVPHAYDITDLAGLSSEHSLFIEVTCNPQRDRAAKRNITGVFQHWDCIDADWNPGGLWRPVRVERTGPVRISKLRVVCHEAHDDRAVLQLHAELDSADTRIGAAAHHRRRPGRAGLRPRPRAGGQRGHLAVRRRQPRAVVAVVARRPAPHPPHGRGVRRRRAQPRHAGPDRPAPGRAPPLDLHRQRRAAVREGRQPRPDPPGAGRGHARRAPPRRRPGPRGRARPRARPRPRQPARAVRRGRRAGDARVAGLPAAVGLRPQHPPPGHTPGPGDGEPARAPPLGRRVVRPQRAAAPRRRGRPAARRRPTSGATPWARCSRRGTARSSTSG